MLFELVTGRHPLPTYSMGELLRIADVDEPMLGVGEVMLDRGPDIAPLAGVIDRCLLKHPEHRTPSARVLLAELEALTPGRRSVLVGNDGSPFAGLAAFQEADADRFFGRDRDIDQVVTELRSRPLLAIVGPSGAGKSSLVRAGVIPALKRSGEGWDAHVVRPGREPLVALAGLLVQAGSSSREIVLPGEDSSGTTVRDSAATSVLGPLIERMHAEPGYLGTRLRARAASNLRRVLVFVDQLEELYTLGAPPDERAAFLACLAAVADDAASPLRVILSMRSDFLDRLTEDRRFGVEVTRSLMLLPPMDRDGMREALLRPIEAAEYRFESPALVDRMVDALADTPGVLPLLQFTAARLWELRDAGCRLLTEASYERLGGVAGALATHADAVLAGMSSARQALARTVLGRLVTPERTRALVSMTELRTLHHDPDAVDDLIQRLAAMRLLVIERGDEGEVHIVELVHESLIDRWPTLARWLDDNQDQLAFLARVRAAAQEWHRSGQSSGMLWRDQIARDARDWYAHYQGELTEREQQFLHAVLDLVDRSQRRKRHLVSGTITVLALLVAAAIGVIVAMEGQNRTIGDQLTALQQGRSALAMSEREKEAARQAFLQAQGEATRVQQQVEEVQASAEVLDREAQQARQESRTSAQAEKRALERAESVARAEKEARVWAEQKQREAEQARLDAEQARDQERKAREELQKLLAREQARRKQLEQSLGGDLTDIVPGAP